MATEYSAVDIHWANKETAVTDYITETKWINDRITANDGVGHYFIQRAVYEEKLDPSEFNMVTLVGLDWLVAW